MSASLSLTLNELDDPRRYAKVVGVAVFDEHTDERWVDAKTGKPAQENAPGSKKLVHQFTRQELDKIARNCNARDREGDFCPLTIGHMILGEPDETRQPEIVGYARNFRVQFDRARGKHLLFADYHIKKEKEQKAREYPRTSVEIWPGKDPIIDPIALLRRTPKRDIGQWTYSRRGRYVLRYSMESDMPDLPLPAPAPDAMDPGATGPSDDEKIEQYQRHCYSHPYARDYHGAMASKYAADAGAGEPPMPPDPTLPPDAGLPEQNMAMAPSATNSAFPQQNARGGASLPQIKDPVLAQHFARQSQIISTLQQQLAQSSKVQMDMLRRTAETEARAVVDRLINDGYSLGADDEVKQFARLTATERASREEYIRLHYSRAPVGGMGRVTLAPTASVGGNGMIDPSNLDATLSESEAQKVLQYSADNGYCDPETAARKLWPDRFAR